MRLVDSRPPERDGVVLVEPRLKPGPAKPLLRERGAVAPPREERPDERVRDDRPRLPPKDERLRPPKDDRLRPPLSEDRLRPPPNEERLRPLKDERLRPPNDERLRPKDERPRLPPERPKLERPPPEREKPLRPPRWAETSSGSSMRRAPKRSGTIEIERVTMAELRFTEWGRTTSLTDTQWDGLRYRAHRGPDHPRQECSSQTALDHGESRLRATIPIDVSANFSSFELTRRPHRT